MPMPMALARVIGGHHVDAFFRGQRVMRAQLQGKHGQIRIRWVLACLCPGDDARAQGFDWRFAIDDEEPYSQSTCLICEAGALVMREECRIGDHRKACRAAQPANGQHAVIRACRHAVRIPGFLLRICVAQPLAFHVGADAHHGACFAHGCRDGRFPATGEAVHYPQGGGGQRQKLERQIQQGAAFDVYEIKRSALDVALPGTLQSHARAYERPHGDVERQHCQPGIVAMALQIAVEQPIGKVRPAVVQ